MNRKMIILLIIMILVGGCTNKPVVVSDLIQPVYEQVMNNDIVLDEKLRTENIAYVDGKYGIIDTNGEIIVDIIYDIVYVTNSGEYLGKKEDGYDLYRNHQIVPEFQEVIERLEKEYDSYVFDELAGLWRVRKNGKRTYVDMEGKQLTTEMFDAVSGVYVWNEQNISVKNIFMAYNSKNGAYVCAAYSMDGKRLTPFDAGGVGSGNHYNCWMETLNIDGIATGFIIWKNDKPTVYDIEGNVVLENVTSASPSWNGLCFVNYSVFEGGKVQSYCLTHEMETVARDYLYDMGDVIIFIEDGKWGVIQKDGEIIIAATYYNMQPLYALGEYYFLAMIDVDTKVLLSPEGEQLFEVKSEYIYGTNNPNVWITTDDNANYKVVNRKGETIIEEEFISVTANYFIVGNRNSGYVVFTTTGELVYENENNYLFNEIHLLPYYIVMENYKEYVADENGKNLGLYLYDIYLNAESNLLIYQDGEKLILDNGEKQMTIDKYDYQSNIEVLTIQGITGIFVKKDNQLQFLDKDLNSHLQIDVDRVSYKGTLVFEELGEVVFLAAEKDGKYALMLESGELLTDFEFDDISALGNYGYLLVKKDGLWASMNYRGEIITDYVYDFSNYEEILHNNVIGEWYSYYIYNDNIQNFGGVYYFFHDPTPDARIIPEIWY